jgi:hypothetical protein
LSFVTQRMHAFQREMLTDGRDKEGKDTENTIGRSSMFVRFRLVASTAFMGTILLCSGCEPVKDEPNPKSKSFDPNDVSEENRRLVRDKMIENGTSPADAEAFTQELYKAEREHRRKNGLPE